MIGNEGIVEVKSGIFIQPSGIFIQPARCGIFIETSGSPKSVRGISCDPWGGTER